MIGTLVERQELDHITMFQSPISGVNDWNKVGDLNVESNSLCFSLLLAELMIGTPSWKAARSR